MLGRRTSVTNTPPPISLEDQRSRIEQLTLLVAERIRAEAGVRASRAAREATLAEQLGGERQRLAARQQSERAAMQSRHSSALSEIVRDYELAIESAAAQHDRDYRNISQDSDKLLSQANAEWDASQDRFRAEYNATVHSLQQSLREFKERIEERRQELRDLETEAERIIRRRRCHRAAEATEEKQGICDPNAPLDVYPTEVSNAKHWLGQFRHQWAPKFLASGALLGIFMVLWLTIIGIGVARMAGEETGTANRAGQANVSSSNPVDSQAWVLAWVGAGGAISAGCVAIIYVVMRPIIVRQTLDVYERFLQSIANADICLDAAIKLRAADADNKKFAAQRLCDQNLRQSTIEHQKGVEELGRKRESRLRETAETLQSQRKAVTENRGTRQKTVNQQFSQDSQQLQELHAIQLRQMEERHQAEISTSNEMHERAWQRLAARWREGMQDFESAVDQMWSYSDERFPPWETADIESLPTTEDTVPALRFGKYSFSLRNIDKGILEHPELRPERVDFDLPAVISFATRPTLLLEAWGEGRAIATRAMQNVMLRLLTAIPPGKVRFTIIDPVGLGQNFSAFMHLADFDEKLITHRIWTETQHINQRLADLTEHMEDVIQTYLRNEFPTIDEYNRQAGEVAEPFHVLVVANFPAGFSDEAAQRLLSIMHSGARCGVYSVISTDSKLDLPRNFDLADLENHATTVHWDGNRFSWRDESLKDLPLVLDEPPRDELLNHTIRVIGRKAKDAIRVEVPFSTVACPPEKWWTHDSRSGIELALGRAGASKLQYLRLGKGTSQHVLISGKTGSGKSTLLHALITNAAIHYSPSEVEFYLIDFKKGVEFKPYASYRLPHARVVAIESEREFGMSVLERLDQELKVRGDLFREAGVQDIKNYRDENPNRQLPRVLLIIDEFQEFFTQDDKLAQEAALLMDRLVRQGRAFGIHVLLGSQTLAGAYSLARSTLGQMAVRIALQCSEADSHLILSEDNTAARLLNRPGEAIYNDANGRFEGNHPFQVVWLSGREQDDYLERLSRRGQNESQIKEPIVFEGNAPARTEENNLLKDLITGDSNAEIAAARQAWLGAAVAIKDPTSVVFRRQSGANLLIVGQQDELALGMLANCVISLGAVSNNGQAPKFIVLDGSRPDSPEAGWWQRLADLLPLNIAVSGVPDSTRQIQELAAEVARRIESGSETEGPIFLIAFNLARFRDLRRSDDDLGFGGFGEEKSISSAKHFTNLLRDGPSVGVHSLIWCDTFNTVNRWLDRATLRELDQRVLFQMSANDSSNLMDSPAASRLGTHRAILFSEELGQQEKFRPYGLPRQEWLSWVAEQLNRRTARV